MIKGISIQLKSRRKKSQKHFYFQKFHKSLNGILQFSSNFWFYMFFILIYGNAGSFKNSQRSKVDTRPKWFSVLPLLIYFKHYVFLAKVCYVFTAFFPSLKFYTLSWPMSHVCSEHVLKTCFILKIEFCAEYKIRSKLHRADCKTPTRFL